MPNKTLTKQAQDDALNFDLYYGDRNCCSCHMHPPCSWCIHPGNPINLEENEDAWEIITTSHLLEDIKNL